MTDYTGRTSLGTGSTRGRANWERSASAVCLVSAVNGLRGPPVKNRGRNSAAITDCGCGSAMRLRRSTSEPKVERDRVKADRTYKARSVHFDHEDHEQQQQQQQEEQQNGIEEDFALTPISIIGRSSSNGNNANGSDAGQKSSSVAAMDDDHEAFSSGDELRQSKKSTGFLQAIKTKIRGRRLKTKSASEPGANTDDEGFESATNNVNAANAYQVLVNGHGGTKTEAGEEADVAAVEDNDGKPEKEMLLLETEAAETEEQMAQGRQASECLTRDLTPEERKVELRKYPYFRLSVVVGSGKDLMAMDRGGTSDPYVRCLHGQDKLFQTRPVAKTVNPVWGETFDVHVDNPFKPINLQVFDRDVVGSDDFMGEAALDLTSLQPRKATDLVLSLNDANDENLVRKNKKRRPLGSIAIRVTLSPMTKDQMNAILRAEKLRGGSSGRSAPSSSSVVHVVLVQAMGLTAMDKGDSSDPYCKLSLGREKAKSKAITGTLNPKWREAFDLFWYDEEEEHVLEITVWDKDIGAKDDFMGRVAIDLDDLTKEVTHNVWRSVEGGDGRVHVLVTVTATTRGDSPSNLSKFDNNDFEQMKQDWMKKYGAPKTFSSMKDVGHLMVKVHRAQGLHSADLNGKSDPFAVLELCNDRLQTNTEYKTLAPAWQKVFHFDVKDIHDVLDVSVYDEDKDHRSEFLGRVKIPLVRVRNDERRWYALKDRKLRKPAKGDNPAILLEMFFVYNKFRASIRTINPKQLKYEDRSDTKFKHSVFMRNVNRVKAATANFDPEIIVNEIKSILNWENKGKTLAAFAGFLLVVYFVQPWMVTLALLIPFIKNILVISVTGGWSTLNDDSECADDDDDDDAAGGKDKDGEKKSLKEKMQAMQEVTLMVQNGLGMLAHVLESLGNVFNFSVPFLSWLAMIIFAIATVLLYYIPLRYLILAWGINKFTKKILRPNALNNNEFIDFISRVPDNEELLDYRELLPAEESSRKSASAAAIKRKANDKDII